MKLKHLKKPVFPLTLLALFENTHHILDIDNVTFFFWLGSTAIQVRRLRGKKM